jgi:hypothetical protein
MLSVKNKASASFFEKKEAKKLLLLREFARDVPRPAVCESFLPQAGSPLFFKKEALF